MAPPSVRSTRVARRLAQVLAELPLPCCAAAASRPGGGRINSLFPPYSPQSQWAAVLVTLLTCGVSCASRLLPAPAPPALELALRAWRLLQALWAALLLWLLLCDPRARSPRAGQEDAALMQCRFGCSIAPAPRTKHCRQCDKCVEGFDHHCLWLNTCVGAHNYRPWLAFVASLCAWAVIGSGISLCGLLKTLRIRSRSLAVGHRPVAFITALLSAATACWLLALLALHAYLTYNGLSTREWVRGAASSNAPAPELEPDEPVPRPTTTAPPARGGAAHSHSPTGSPSGRSQGAAVQRRSPTNFVRSMSMPSTPHAQDLAFNSISRRTHSFIDEHERQLHTGWRRYIFLSNVDTLDHHP